MAATVAASASPATIVATGGPVAGATGGTGSVSTGVKPGGAPAPVAHTTAPSGSPKSPPKERSHVTFSPSTIVVQPAGTASAIPSYPPQSYPQSYPPQSYPPQSYPHHPNAYAAALPIAPPTQPNVYSAAQPIAYSAVRSAVLPTAYSAAYSAALPQPLTQQLMAVQQQQQQQQLSVPPSLMAAAASGSQTTTGTSSTVASAPAAGLVCEGKDSFSSCALVPTAYFVNKHGYHPMCEPCIEQLLQLYSEHHENPNDYRIDRTTPIGYPSPYIHHQLQGGASTASAASSATPLLESEYDLSPLAHRATYRIRFQIPFNQVDLHSELRATVFYIAFGPAEVERNPNSVKWCLAFHVFGTTKDFGAVTGGKLCPRDETPFFADDAIPIMWKRPFNDEGTNASSSSSKSALDRPSPALSIELANSMAMAAAAASSANAASSSEAIATSRMPRTAAKMANEAIAKSREELKNIDPTEAATVTPAAAASAAASSSAADVAATATATAKEGKKKGKKRSNGVFEDDSSIDDATPVVSRKRSKHGVSRKEGVVRSTQHTTRKNPVNLVAAPPGKFEPYPAWADCVLSDSIRFDEPRLKTESVVLRVANRTVEGKEIKCIPRVPMLFVQKRNGQKTSRSLSYIKLRQGVRTGYDKRFPPTDPNHFIRIDDQEEKGKGLGHTYDLMITFEAGSDINKLIAEGWRFHINYHTRRKEDGKQVTGNVMPIFHHENVHFRVFSVTDGDGGEDLHYELPRDKQPCLDYVEPIVQPPTKPHHHQHLRHCK